VKKFTLPAQRFKHQGKPYILVGNEVKGPRWHDGYIVILDQFASPSIIFFQVSAGPYAHTGWFRGKIPAMHNRTLLFLALNQCFQFGIDFHLRSGYGNAAHAKILYKIK